MTYHPCPHIFFISKYSKC